MDIDDQELSTRIDRHHQKVLPQLRRRRTRCLIRDYTISTHSAVIDTSRGSKIGFIQNFGQVR